MLRELGLSPGEYCVACVGGTVNVAFRKSALTTTGELGVYSSVADSGARMRRSFCPKCGTPMFSEAEERPHVVFVRVGTHGTSSEWKQPDLPLGPPKRVRGECLWR